MRSTLLLTMAFGLLLVLFSYQRLQPESSPVARGAAHASSQPCADSSCQAEIAGQLHRCDELSAKTSCADVAAYWSAVALQHKRPSRLALSPENRLLQGEILASQKNCFRCHGQLGQGGIANPGALKGYIPGYFGQDFVNLTEGGKRSVILEWITTGTSTTLTSSVLTGGLARFFLARQAISMPAFSELTNAELELLVDYIVSLNELGPLDVETVARYAAATASPGVLTNANPPTDYVSQSVR